MTQSDTTWCPSCDTHHDTESTCPGRLLATTPERVGWRVEVETDSGTRVHAVMIARAGNYWRARIATLPDQLWRTPGSDSGVKFACVSATSVESLAKRYILERCRALGHRVTGDPVDQSPRDIAAEGLGTDAGRSTRCLRPLPIRVTGEGLAVDARAADLSAEGLFVATDRLLSLGSAIRVDLEIDDGAVSLDATVIWHRRSPDGGRPAGMGLRLRNPPERYVHFTDSLHRERPDAELVPA